MLSKQKAADVGLDISPFNCGIMLDCSDLDVGGEVRRAYAEQEREKRRDRKGDGKQS